ncbi:MAG: ThuA domain-containing protein [Pirellulales bacterium]|nr:ThuA domain-containing protein [Pirellulales bacterium]
MKRRELLAALGAAGLAWPLGCWIRAAEKQPGRRVLFFSRSVLFEHPVVHRNGEELSFAETQFVELARRAGLEADCTKDGSVFDGGLDGYAAIVSYSCGTMDDMLKPESKDHSAPISERGRQRLVDAVGAGKPLVAIHPGFLILPEVVGTGYVGHGQQQAGTMRIVSPKFPGTAGLGDSFSMTEEWFSLVDFAKDLHVVLVQETAGMQKEQPGDQKCYNRPPYPATWARLHGKTCVFYTSMGHREDVWAHSIFQQILLGGLLWALGEVEADVTPNIATVAPQANQRAR